MLWCRHFWQKKGGIFLQDEKNSKVVQSITIEVISDKYKGSKETQNYEEEINLSANFSDEETIRILEKCFISLEKEASQIRSTN